MSIIQTRTTPIPKEVILSAIDDRIVTDVSSAEDIDILNKISNSLKNSGNIIFEWTGQEHHYLDTQPRDKWLRYLVYRYKMKVIPKMKIVLEFPTYLLIEPVSFCNLRCVMCFQVDKTFTKKPYMGLMELDFFKKVIDEAVSGGAQAITLASRGEPTMHPELDKMLDYASEKFIDLKLNTNATKLTEKLSHAILSSSVNELVFSVDAADKITYEEIRVRGKFDEVLENIERFHRIREEFYPYSGLRTRISGVIVRDDLDLNVITRFWQQRVDDVVFVEAEHRWDTYNNNPHDDINTPCNYLWERMYVWFDGICNPCDVDYKSKLRLGDLNKSSISDIWHGEYYTDIRKQHLQLNRKQYNPCDRCGIS